jgi:hypothetical protein
MDAITSIEQEHCAKALPALAIGLHACENVVGARIGRIIIEFGRARPCCRDHSRREHQEGASHGCHQPHQNLRHRIFQVILCG